MDLDAYIKDVRKLIKADKFLYAFNKEDIIKLQAFVNKLEVIRKQVPDLETFMNWASPDRDDSIGEFVAEAPTLIREKLEELLYD